MYNTRINCPHCGGHVLDLVPANGTRVQSSTTTVEREREVATTKAGSPRMDGKVNCSRCNPDGKGCNRGHSRCQGVNEPQYSQCYRCKMDMEEARNNPTGNTPRRGGEFGTERQDPDEPPWVPDGKNLEDLHW